MEDKFSSLQTFLCDVFHLYRIFGSQFDSQASQNSLEHLFFELQSVSEVQAIKNCVL